MHEPKNTITDANDKQNEIQPMQEQEVDKIDINDQEEQEQLNEEEPQHDPLPAGVPEEEGLTSQLQEATEPAKEDQDDEDAHPQDDKSDDSTPAEVQDEQEKEATTATGPDTNPETTGVQDKSPIKQIAQAFKEVDKTLQGNIWKIQKADTRQQVQRKLCKARKRKRLRWGADYNRDAESPDKGTIEIDGEETYTPINPRMNSVKKRVYNLRSRRG
eukprot:8521941-Ditylum_brightwellii.AAC.1